MNLFAIIINSEMHYIIDTENSEKNRLLDEYISSYYIPKNIKSIDILNKLLADVKKEVNLELIPIKLIDIYRPYEE